MVSYAIHCEGSRLEKVVLRVALLQGIRSCRLGPFWALAGKPFVGAGIEQELANWSGN